MSASLRATSDESTSLQLRIAQAADTDGEMDVLLDHVDRAVDQQEIDRQRRIAAQKFRKQRRDYEPAHQAWRTDPNAPRRLVTVVRQRRLDLPDLTDDCFGALV